MAKHTCRGKDLGVDLQILLLWYTFVFIGKNTHIQYVDIQYTHQQSKVKSGSSQERSLSDNLENPMFIEWKCMHHVRVDRTELN